MPPFEKNDKIEGTESGFAVCQIQSLDMEDILGVLGSLSDLRRELEVLRKVSQDQETKFRHCQHGVICVF